jgi:hypothetical protein
LKLPVIVVYPDFKTTDELLNDTKNGINNNIKSLWNKLPIFKNSKSKVPILHIPLNKRERIKMALENASFRTGSGKILEIIL